MQKENGCQQVPGLPRKTKVDFAKRHACHANRLSGRPTAPNRATRPSPAQTPKCPSATPATQNEGGCQQVPRLPRKRKVDVAKCHPCHAKRRCACPGARGDQQLPSAPPNPAQFPNCHACHAKADITKCHTCHVKRRVASINQDLQKPIPSQSTCGTWYTWYTGRRVDKLKNAFSKKKKKRPEAKKSGGRVQNGRFFPPFGRLFPPFGRVGGKILGNQTKKRVFLKKRY